VAYQPAENPGCLQAIFSLFKAQQKAPEALPYRLRDDFLSPSEYTFYKVLTSVLGMEQSILAKVRLADIFFAARPQENLAFLNRISGL
jgi:hypothetical protein